MNKGIYVMLLKTIKKQKLRCRKKEFILEEGIYAYVGSGMKDLAGRVKRHLSSKKKKWWHIDYLLENAEVLWVLLIPTEKRKEEIISEKLSHIFPIVQDFGSSDLKTKSNLFVIDDDRKLLDVILSTLKE